MSRVPRGVFLGVLLFAQATAPLRAQPVTATPHRTAVITFSLKDVPSEEAARRLGEALGITIAVEPTSDAIPRITLQLQEVSPLEALDRFAASLHGRWQSVYMLTPTVPGVAPPAPAFASGRRVTLNLANVTPRVALNAVASADQGEVEGVVPEVPRIGLKLEDVPVEEGMDRVSNALGLHWSRRFRIIPRNAVGLVAQPEVTAASPSAPPTVNGAPNPPAAAEKLFSLTDPTSPSAPSSERSSVAKSRDLARALSEGIAKLMQIEPSRRGSVVRQFSQQVERGLREVDSLPAAEQSQQRARLVRVYQSGMRMYRGLTPDQQQEFRPLFDVLRRWLRL